MGTMTKLPFGTGPVIRELPVEHMFRSLIVEIHPTMIVYREKGRSKPLGSVSHAVLAAQVASNAFDGMKGEGE